MTLKKNYIVNSNLINLNEIFDTELDNIWIFPNNYSELISSLEHIQHRGKDSCGISYNSNNSEIKTIKDMVEPKVDTTKTEEYQGGWRLW